MKRTQAEKLKRVLMCGSLQYEGATLNGANIISFTPNQKGIEYNIPYLKLECASPFELIDLIVFEYLERKPRNNPKTTNK